MKTVLKNLLNICLLMLISTYGLCQNTQIKTVPSDAPNFKFFIPWANTHLKYAKQ